MPLNIVCPLGHKIEVSRRFAGKTIKCPKCSRPVMVLIPAVPPVVQDEPLEFESAARSHSPVSKKSKRETFRAIDERPLDRMSGLTGSVVKWLILSGGGLLLLIVGIVAGAMLSR